MLVPKQRCTAVRSEEVGASPSLAFAFAICEPGTLTPRPWRPFFHL